MSKMIKKIGTFCKIFQEEGLAVLLYKTGNKIQTVQKSRMGGEYRFWIKKNENDRNILHTEPLEYQPKISVVVPVYNVETKMLEDCIQSVLKQTYPHWELCLADDASTWTNVRECLSRYEGNEKIKICYREENGHISRCTNSAIQMAEGEFIAFMDCDDVLAPNALYEVAKKLNEDKTLDFIYSDEDKIDETGRNRHEPHFKPDWSPDTFMSLMYTCHLGVYRRTVGEKIGWLREGYEGAQDYDFTLRFTEETQRIGHIPKILYHWRERKESTAINPEAKSYILDTAKKAKEDALKRRGFEGEVEWVEGIYQYRVNYKVPDQALVSVIIPSKDNFEVMRRCVDSLVEKTAYPHYEIIIVDNGSKEEQKEQYQAYCSEHGYTYHYQAMDFNFSRMCNIGAGKAKGQLLLFLNDDITIANQIWMERMAGHASLPYVGAVGAKLLYPDSTLIQHIGVISFTGGPVHSFCQFDDTPTYYFCRNKIEYNYSAVTAACLMIEAKKFWEVDGFDESFAVAYNDIDFCFKLTEKDYYNVSRMDAVLYHHESLSRGNDAIDPVKMQRLLEEREHLYREHPQYVSKDQCYSPNLTMRKADCSVNIDFRHKIRKPLPVDKHKFTVRQDISYMNYGIRYLEVNHAYINIEGWCFNEKKGRNNWRKNRLILENEKEDYLCETTQEYSEAMAYYAGRKGYYNLCAFSASIDRKELPPGNYHLSIVREGKRIPTDSSFYLPGYKEEQ